MKKEKYTSQYEPMPNVDEIPDLEIIDLDDTSSDYAEEAQNRNSLSKNMDDSYTMEEASENHYFGEEYPVKDSPESEDDYQENEYEEEAYSEEEDLEENPPKKFRINIHIVLLVAVAACIIAIVVKFSNWGVLIDQDELFQDGEGTYVDTWDNIVPLLNEEHEVIPLKKSDGLNIVLFGNTVFSDDRYLPTGFASILEDMTGANVYNCSLSGSYLTSELPFPNAEVQPWDAFTFYWMSLLTTDFEVGDYYEQSVAALGADAPPEANEVRDTLRGIDFDEVDVIAILYDATDYLMGHNLNSAEEYEPIQRFTGNLEAGLDILIQQHPNIRVIVLSPTYAYSNELDDNGDYISSDIHIYNEQPLSMYAIAECMSCSDKGVTFVDNIYGTFTEDNAKDHLTDNLHLNEEGRRKVALRLIEAMNYFGSN